MKTEREKRCVKVPHVGSGYLHAEDDDGPYDVDGVMYCGRCHVALPHGNERLTAYESGVQTLGFADRHDMPFEIVPEEARALLARLRSEHPTEGEG